MADELDLQSMSARADEVFDIRHRPEFVTAERRPGARPDWMDLVFPSGLACTTNSVAIETEHIYNEIFRERVYLPSSISVADGDTIVDVGANIGMFTLFILGQFPHATLHCIEPVPANFEVLRRNLERYRHHDVRLHGVALGSDPEGRAEILYYPHFTGNSTLHPETGRVQREYFSSLFSREEMDFLYQEQRIAVPITTLSALMRREGIDVIDLLKLDAEGSEIDIFHGIEMQDWSRIRQIAMEVHDADVLLPQVIEILTSRGMRPSVDESTRDRAADVVVSATHR